VFPRFLTMRVLMVGCAAGEGELGAISMEDESWTANGLQSCLRNYARQKKASLVVFKDFSSRYRAALENLLRYGYTRVPSMPMTGLSLKHASFDDYLGAL